MPDLSRWISSVLLSVSATLAWQGHAFAEAETPRVDPEAAQKETKLAVQFTFDGMIAEQGLEEDPLQLLAGETKCVGVREWVQRLEKAAGSARVGCVLLVLDQPELSWTHALELQRAVLKLKQSGKAVLAFGESFTPAQLLLAGAADKLYLNPNGWVLLNGLSIQALYFKGTLDKLGVQADILHLGTHKGAGEPFTLAGPSKEAQEMMNWLLDDRYALLSEQIGKCRGKDAAAGKKWIDGGPYTAKQALEAGLVDGLKGRLEVYREIKKLAGLRESDKLERRFGKEKKKTGLDFSNPLSLFKFFADLASSTKEEAPQPPAVGLLYAEGIIEEGRSEGAGTLGSLSLISAIEKARKDATVKAVVLRVDSPGGSAMASEGIHEALVKLKAEKPLVVSVAAVGASGGYYIAAPAERIFVHPTSIVGSIGVVGGKMVLKGLFDWLGITTHPYRRGGERAGLFDSTTPFSLEEKKWVLSSMEEVYARFVKAVQDGRGEKLKDFEAKITGGKVFTGRQALANGLADELGGIEEALAFAAVRGGLKKTGYAVRVINKPAGFTQKIIDALSGEDGEKDDAARAVSGAGPSAWRAEEGARAAAAVLPALAGPWAEALGALRKAHPAHAAAMSRQLRYLEMLRCGRLLLAMPTELVFAP